MVGFPRREDWDRLLQYVRLGSISDIQSQQQRQPFWLGYGYDRTSLVDQIRAQAPGTKRMEMLEAVVELGLDPVGHEFTEQERTAVERGLAKAPTWRKQAWEQGVKEIYVVRQKAWGLSFAPGDGQCPTRYGGDYDGQYPVSAADALRDYDRDVKRYELAKSARWFRPYLTRMASGQNFTLNEVLSQLGDTRQIVRR